MNQIIIHGQEADQLPKATDISKTNPYDKRIIILCLEFPHPKKTLPSLALVSCQ